jgi:hypothetical protein
MLKQDKNSEPAAGTLHCFSEEGYANRQHHYASVKKNLRTGRLFFLSE